VRATTAHFIERPEAKRIYFVGPYMAELGFDPILFFFSIYLNNCRFIENNGKDCIEFCSPLPRAPSC
jgi:hypothetical protein